MVDFSDKKKSCQHFSLCLKKQDFMAIQFKWHWWISGRGKYAFIG